MFGIANRRLMREIEEREMLAEIEEMELKSFVKKLKKLVKKSIVIKNVVGDLSVRILLEISGNDKCVLLEKEMEVFYVKSVSWVKDHFVDSFSK